MLDTCHFERSALKDIACRNMVLILVTLDTSHFERSALKDIACRNMVLILVTLDGLGLGGVCVRC